MSNKTFGVRVTDFFRSLELDVKLPYGVEVMNPYRDPWTMQLTQVFYERYFNDTNPRVYLYGINPGRKGAGATGVAFTDPVALSDFCGIENNLEKQRELSSRFVYEMIDACGGVTKFYQRFYITSLSPLGFVKRDKNYNYYDDAALQKAVEPFAIRTIGEQIAFGAKRKVAICLGTGKNFKYFQGLNARHNFFDEIIPLEHPRYIMQYKLKTMKNYISKYVEVLQAASRS